MSTWRMATYEVIIKICLNTHLSQQCPNLSKKSREQHSDASTAQSTSINWQDEGQAVNFPAGALCTEKMNHLNKTLSPAVQYHL